jgi:hypothetical protein
VDSGSDPDLDVARPAPVSKGTLEADRPRDGSLGALEYGEELVCPGIDLPSPGLPHRPANDIAHARKKTGIVVSQALEEGGGTLHVGE